MAIQLIPQVLSIEDKRNLSTMPKPSKATLLHNAKRKQVNGYIIQGKKLIKITKARAGPIIHGSLFENRRQFCLDTAKCTSSPLAQELKGKTTQKTPDTRAEGSPENEKKVVYMTRRVAAEEEVKARKRAAADAKRERMGQTQEAKASRLEADLDSGHIDLDAESEDEDYFRI